jgi:small subunit ribosomal protein S11e
MKTHGCHCCWRKDSDQRIDQKIEECDIYVIRPAHLSLLLLCYPSSTVTKMPRIAREYKECDQHEKAYQSQDAIFVARKRAIGNQRQKPMRYIRSVGLGIKTPDAAIEGNYVDKKCPFTGNVSIRGRILKGLVISNKMKNTIVIRRDYLHYIVKYRRFEKRHKNISVHCSPAFNVKEGDVVTVGQCRPLSKTVRFNVVAHEPAINAGTGKKSFRTF